MLHSEASDAAVTLSRVCKCVCVVNNVIITLPGLRWRKYLIPPNEISDFRNAAAKSAFTACTYNITLLTS